MTRKQWYFYALMLPYALPVLVMTIAAVTHRFLSSQSILGWLSLFAMLQLTFSGFQYFVFIFFVYSWGKDKSPAQLFRASWVLPLWFWPWCTMWLLVITMVIGNTKMFFLLGLASIPCGYFYVLITHVIGWSLRKARLIV